MSKNKKAIIGFLITLIIVIGIVVVYKIIEISVTDGEGFKYNVENVSSTTVDTVNNEKNKVITEWNEITEDGVNKELLLQK